MPSEAIKILGLTVIAFFVALTITPLIFRLLQKFGARKQIRVSEDTPIFARLHAGKAGTPTMGGTIIWLTVLGLAAIFALLSRFADGLFDHLNFLDRAQTYLPLAAMLIAALLGLVDDILGVLRIGVKGGGLSVRYKLLMYAAIGGLGAWWFYAPANLDWHILHIPFVGNFDIGWWYIPFFILVMAASAFSANEADGLDGLLGGISLFVFGGFLVISFMLHRYDLAAMIGAIIGSLLAFLWFNIYPAKFFMGDTGSMTLGITIGVIAMLTNTALLLPILAFPLVVESLSVLIQLFGKKILHRKIFLSTPIHHHYEALGLPETRITMRFWIIGFVFSALGVALFFLDTII
jgi:phospho-N-acetylmuramoyl-pentapeptide-transferase